MADWLNPAISTKRATNTLCPDEQGIPPALGKIPTLSDCYEATFEEEWFLVAEAQGHEELSAHLG